MIIYAESLGNIEENAADASVPIYGTLGCVGLIDKGTNVGEGIVLAPSSVVSATDQTIRHAVENYNGLLRKLAD